MAPGELRLAVTVRDRGESPARLRRLMAEAETALSGVTDMPGWQMVTLRFLRSRAFKEARGDWVGIVEFRARMLEE